MSEKKYVIRLENERRVTYARYGTAQRERTIVEARGNERRTEWKTKEGAHLALDKPAPKYAAATTPGVRTIEDFLKKYCGFPIVKVVDADEEPPIERKEAIAKPSTDYQYWQTLLETSSRFLEAHPESATGETLALHFRLKELCARALNVQH